MSDKYVAIVSRRNEVGDLCLQASETFDSREEVLAWCEEQGLHEEEVAIACAEGICDQASPRTSLAVEGISKLRERASR